MKKILNKNMFNLAKAAWPVNYLIVFTIIGLCILIPSNIMAFYDNTHMNSAEDAIIFMETEGSNQQRWAADYLKAKAGGRYSGAEFNSKMTHGQQNGLIGIARAGATAPDYFQDTFWSDTTGFSWKFSIFGAFQNNYTAYSHFMNLLKQNDDGKNIKTSNYNDYDGYSYNASFGASDMSDAGIDYVVASYMNDAQMTIDLPNCKECSDKFTIVPNGNPAMDYKQNGSTTPLGVPRGDKKLGSDDGTNYNCFSDSNFNDCPDRGDKYDGIYQIPNTNPGESSSFSSDEDWVIMEPLDNAATFYFNEWFIEGGNSKNSSLEPQAAKNRYYSITAPDITYLTLAMHYAGDSSVQIHIWNTLGYNHSGYEEWIEDHYGKRSVGSNDTIKNFEDYSLVKAFMKSRANGILNDVDNILTENAFYTYLARFRSGYDIMKNEDDGTRKNAAVYAVNQAIVNIALLYEKAVCDLRKYR